MYIASLCFTPAPFHIAKYAPECANGLRVQQPQILGARTATAQLSVMMSMSRRWHINK